MKDDFLLHTALAFVGGIADSGKSLLLDQLSEPQNTTKILRVSEALRKHLHLTGGDRLPPSVGYTDWKTLAEEAAVDTLSAEIIAWREVTGNRPMVAVLNTHFATYSPAGFLPGLDPDSLWKLCKACDLDTAGAAFKAGVILIDIGIPDVLRYRESEWAKPNRGFSPAPALAAELEFNRLYSLYYYHTLASYLTADRVVYRRLVLRWRQMAPGLPIEQTDGFAPTQSAIRTILRSLYPPTP